MWLRLRQMLVKEFIQVFRDKRTRFILFGPPIIQMVIFGYAATLEIQHVPIGDSRLRKFAGKPRLRFALRGQPLLRRS